MAHRIIGELTVGNVVKVYAPHECTFARYTVSHIRCAVNSDNVESFTLRKGTLERYYIVREHLSKNEHRCTLEITA